MTVVRRPRASGRPAGAAVLDRTDAGFSDSYEIAIPAEPIRHHFVEIRDPTRGHKLITLIEILSPSNKRRGPDREAYRRKQTEILESDANLIELDFLRGGERVLPQPELAAWLAGLDPPADYVVLVNRSWRRDRYQVFPIGLRGSLPRIPVPLRDGEPEVPLDLQVIADRTYDGGPYRRGAVDYSRSPDPPLPAPDAAWAEGLLRDRGRPPLA